MPRGERSGLGLALVTVWLAFTVSLSGWWLVFGLRQAERLGALEHDRAAALGRTQRMLLWEGAVLIVSLLAGGVALLSYVRRERERHREVEDFFAAFTHDMKTALASLRLQVESLEEDLGERGRTPLFSRLLKDSVRLQLQLENSLFFAHRRAGRLLREDVPLRSVIDRVRQDWPELTIVQEADPIVSADLRALESVVRNVLQNAVVHGKADRVTIRAETVSDSRVRLILEDDGHGVSGDVARLGQPFFSQGPDGGTGMGLYISRQLARRMGGELKVASSASGGLAVAITLPQGGPR